MPSSTIVNDTLFNELSVHLDKLQLGSTPPDYSLISQSQARLQNIGSNIHNNSSDLHELNAVGSVLAPKLMNLLRSSEDEELRSMLVDLLQALLSLFSFETILDRYVSMEVINEAIDSEVDELAVLAIKIISNSDPADFIVHTGLIAKMISLFSDQQTSTKVVNEIEKALLNLSSRGEQVKTEISSKDFVDVFYKMRFDHDPSGKLKPRLMDFISGLLNLITDIPDELYLVDLQEFTKEDDVLFLAYLISFYNNLLILSQDYSELTFLSGKMREQLDYTARLYTDDKFKSDSKFFFSLEPVILLANLSLLYPENFESLDGKYNILKKAEMTRWQDDSNYLLYKASPLAIKKSLGSEFISSLPLSSKTLGIYQNLISNETTFQELSLTSNKLQNLQIIEFLEIMNTMSSQPFSCQSLIQEYPSCMNRLLNETVNVSNTEVWKLKISILENLLRFKEIVGIWEPKILESYSLMKQGRSVDPSVDIYDTVA